LAGVADADPNAARELAARHDSPSFANARELIERSDADVVCIATPNGFLADLAIAALDAGKHVLLEKPMGRNLAEAQRIAAAAARTGRKLKVGFNHRYHPAIAAARQRIHAGEVGDLINVRVRYGHGGRPGYEKEWRGNPELAGGGELLDQGVHVVDLLHWFAGIPESAFGFTQTAVWPVTPLEDNAFGLFRYAGGTVASMHTSWTQWKNLFSFEAYGSTGSITVDGLGRSYGTERMTVAVRNKTGGVPAMSETLYDDPDRSWEREWDDFATALLTGSPYLGTPQDGLVAMSMIAALYESARTGTLVSLGTAAKTGT
jgi:predicted dehydrogenase